MCSGKGGDGEMGLQVEGEDGREPPQYCLWSSAKVVVCRSTGQTEAYAGVWSQSDREGRHYSRVYARVKQNPVEWPALWES